VCPDGLHSLPGSTAASDCFDNSLTFNLHIVEAAANRFSSYSKAMSEFQPVAEGGQLTEPFAMVFISTTNLLITTIAGVLEFRYDGTLVGLFAGLSNAGGLLLLPDLGQVAVSSTKWTGNLSEKRVLFFALREGINGGALNEVQAVGKVIIPLTATHPFYTEDVVRVGGASNQILVGLRHETGATRKVFKCCIPNTDCTGDPQALINYFSSEYSADPWRIAVIPGADGFLVPGAGFNLLLICPAEYSIGMNLAFDIQGECAANVIVENSSQQSLTFSLQHSTISVPSSPLSRTARSGSPELSWSTRSRSFSL
jgi:hypothetical protein